MLETLGLLALRALKVLTVPRLLTLLIMLRPLLSMLHLLLIMLLQRITQGIIMGTQFFLTFMPIPFNHKFMWRQAMTLVESFTPQVIMEHTTTLVITITTREVGTTRIQMTIMVP